MKRRVHNPRLLYTLTDIEVMKGGPYVSKFLTTIPTAVPVVYPGPLKTGGVGSELEKALDSAGRVARDSALGWRLTGTQTLLQQAADFLRAWAKGNTPTDYADCGDKWAGSYMSHGLFMFAHAYDLIRGANLLTPTQEAEVRAWLEDSYWALVSFVDRARYEWVMMHRDHRTTYRWDESKTYLTLDSYVGGDNMALVAVARYAIAKVLGLVVEKDEFNPDNILDHALRGDNDGDGTVSRCPCENFWAVISPGRGGCIDYMTYNTRACTVLYEMSVTDPEWSLNLRDSWLYLEEFFDGTRQPFSPGDVINATACLPRFRHASKVLGIEFGWLPDRWYYEPQFLGPVSVTCWRA